MTFESPNEDVLEYMRQRRFEGHDPFDFLNSKLFQHSGLQKFRLARLAWIQLGKRLPINLRSLLRVPRQRNPKAIALVILGLLQDYQRTSGGWYLSEAIALADWLLDQRADLGDWGHACWGYNFDWQARAFFVPRGTPNIISTCYAARALYALGQLTQNGRFTSAALDAASFIRNSLLFRYQERHFLAYIPGEEAVVHNASLWGAAWLAEAGAAQNDEAMQSLAFEVARSSVDAQSHDGSWAYGNRTHHQFIDGFHTGFVLESLHILSAALKTDEFDSPIARGMDFYRRKFMASESVVPYYHNKLYPLDMHSFSQAVITLLVVERGNESAELAKRIMASALETLYLPKLHRFAYQRHRFLVNKIDYCRWTQAWAYYAMALLNNRYARGENEEN